MMSKMPATIWYCGTVNVSFGFRIVNLGINRLSKTLPSLRFWVWLVMTEPPFISEPVPTIVNTQPTGRMRRPGAGFLPPR